ncbi:unnamed protein product [Ranitomeya imitator]|uniref:Uncharacterized protein n=1 Tax=Ranitomeya imitator TaxID=111125 RepID=A0ABN9MNN2_9NEOB|nr:unnamed protein product [Ranitomeya imitator]
MPQDKEMMLSNGGRHSDPSDNEARTWDLPTSPDQRLSRSQSDMFSPQTPLALTGPYSDFLPDTPARFNPFSQREDLKGGRIKLYDTPSKSVISLTFDLPPPMSYQLSSPITPEPMLDAPCEFSDIMTRPRRCRSLPSSPEIVRRGSSCSVTTPMQRSHQDNGESGNYWHTPGSRDTQTLNGFLPNHFPNCLPQGNSPENLSVTMKSPKNQQSNGISSLRLDKDLTLNPITQPSCPEWRAVQPSDLQTIIGDVKESPTEGSIPQCNVDKTTRSPPCGDDKLPDPEPLDSSTRVHECKDDSFQKNSHSGGRKLQDRLKDWSRKLKPIEESSGIYPEMNHSGMGEPMDCSSSPESAEENAFCRSPPCLQNNGSLLAASTSPHSSSCSTPSSSRSPSPPVSPWQLEAQSVPNRLSLSDNNNVVGSKPISHQREALYVPSLDFVQRFCLDEDFGDDDEGRDDVGSDEGHADDGRDDGRDDVGYDEGHADGGRDDGRDDVGYDEGHADGGRDDEGRDDVGFDEGHADGDGRDDDQFVKHLRV